MKYYFNDALDNLQPESDDDFEEGMDYDYPEIELDVEFDED